MEEKITKNCPYCGKEILIKAKKCKHCGKWLNNEINTSQQLAHPISQQKKMKETVTSVVVENVNIKICPYCCQKIPENAQKCQFCGEWINQKTKRENQAFGCCKGLIGVIIVIVGVILECATNGGGAGLLFAIVGAIVMGIYFLPTTIADEKRHKNTTAIFVVNLFFGYTVIGWVIALVWALTEEH